MRLVSVSVGLPRDVEWHHRTVRTSIWKTPVAGRVPLTTLNLEGDRQSDLSVHGGRNKAVYIYPSEHYEYWRRELPGIDLPWGSFGENLTTEGLLETEVRILDGDDAPALNLRLFREMQGKPEGPLSWFGGELDEPAFLARMAEEGRLIYEFDVHRTYGLG